MRQQRNRKTCGELDALESIKNRKSNKCADLFQQLNVDTDNYNPGWMQKTNLVFTKQFWRIYTPWQHQSAWQLASIYIFGENQLYDGSGYSVQLGRNLANSLSVLKYIQEYKWIDERTRVIFIEFTLYGVNANLFNIVSIIAERTAYGNYILNFNIKTVKLLLVLENMPGIIVFVFIIFIGFTMIFLLRILIKLFKMQMKIFLQNIWNILDILIVILNIGAVLMYFQRNKYVHELLGRLQQTRNNEFVSFFYAAFFDECLTWWCGILLTFATVRLWKLFNFLKVFRLVSKTFAKCANTLASLTLIAILFLVMFAVCVHIINGAHSKQFSTISSTIVSLAFLCFGFADDNINPENLLYGGKEMGILLYIILMFAIAIYLLNMFITVICCYFSVMQEDLANNKDTTVFTETFWQFLKREFFGWTQFCTSSIDKRTSELVYYGAGQEETNHFCETNQTTIRNKFELEKSKARLRIMEVQFNIIGKVLNDVMTQNQKNGL